MFGRKGTFTIADAKAWARKNPVEGVGITKTKKAAQRLPPEPLPSMVDLLADGGPEALAAAAALHFNGAQVESDATETSDPTWYRVTLLDGSVLSREARQPPAS